ncbi:hypothetical protein F4604DRAFT_1684915 [Suillus subluteus]|nr:hypothetical protein F4604DRAFT_1684915 [Suillus subluteus]
MHQQNLPTVPQHLQQIREHLVDSGLYLGHSAFRDNIRWCRMGKADRLVVQNTLYVSGTNDPASESALELAIISAVMQISSNDFYLTADTGYKGPSTICLEYSSIKPSCTNEQLDIKPFKADFDVVKNNLRWLQDVATTDGFILKHGLVPPYTDGFRSKVRHVLFELLSSNKINDTNSENLENDRNSIEVKADKLDGIFLIKNWPTFSNAARGGLEGIKTTHRVVLIPAYDMKGATIELHFTLTHWSIHPKRGDGTSGIDTYTADIVMILQQKSGVKRPIISLPAILNLHQHKSPVKLYLFLQLAVD